MTLRVSVIVPVYNEAATILQLLREVRAQYVDGVSFEIVVVDDGSRDDTVALLESRRNLYDKLIQQPTNGGKGAAAVAGMKVASGDYILFQDADLEYSPSHYAALLFPVRMFGADVVMGSRFLASPYTRVQYYWHKVGNGVITRLFNTCSIRPSRTSSPAICCSGGRCLIPVNCGRWDSRSRGGR